MGSNAQDPIEVGPEAGPAHSLGASRMQHKLEEAQRQERGEAGKPEAMGCAGGREEGPLRTQQTDQPPGPRSEHKEGRERQACSLQPGWRLRVRGRRADTPQASPPQQSAAPPWTHWDTAPPSPQGDWTLRVLKASSLVQHDL